MILKILVQKRSKKQTLNQQNQGFLTNKRSYWIFKRVPKGIGYIPGNIDFQVKKVKNLLAVKPMNPIFATRLTQTSFKDGRFVYRLGQPPFTGQRRVRLPYRLQSVIF